MKPANQSPPNTQTGHAHLIGRGADARVVWTSGDGIVDAAGFDEIRTKAVDGGLVRATEAADDAGRKAA